MTVFLKVYTTTPAPAILHACRESRRVALGIYDPLTFRGRATGTFVNFSADQVFLKSHFSDGFWHRSLQQDCKTLVLTRETFLKSFLQRRDFTALDKLIIVLHSEGKKAISLVQPVYPVPVGLMELHATAQKFVDAGQIKCFQIRHAIRDGGKIADAREKVIKR